MENHQANSEGSNPREEENEESDDNIIVINIDGFDLTDNENQEDNSYQPKEEIKDPSYSNVSNNQDLNMDAEDPSLNEQLRPTFNTTDQNEGDLNTLRGNPSEILNPPSAEPERSSEEASQHQDNSSNNELVVKLNLNHLDLGDNGDNPTTNIKQDEEESKTAEKTKSNGNIPHQPILSNNNSVMHMLASPNTPNMETTSNLDILNGGQVPKGGIKKLLGADAPFQIEGENMEDSDSSDEDMKISIQYDKENRQFFIQDNS